jgi:RNA polymerase sigma-70 factor (ECF subfamily)
MVEPGVVAQAGVDEARVGRIFRAESGRSVATLIRIFGDIDIAEDAVQDAFALALSRWPAEGLPPNPGGWITTTARNGAIDRLRREARGRELLEEVAVLWPVEDQPAPDEETPTVSDDRLRLIFTCCHPALSLDALVSLTLRLLAGLSTAQVARAFLVAEATMAQRLVRVKRKISAARIPYRVPQESHLPARLRPVLKVVYLIYTVGADQPITANGEAEDLRLEGIRLARLLARLLPDQPEVAGLLALLLLSESRRRARVAGDGSLVLLRDQDRRCWDRALIDEGQAIVRDCLQRNTPGPYQLQAAINAVHADATSIEDTDWSQILALYDHLLALTPTPVIALNRAVAVGEVAGPGAAMALVEVMDLDGYHPFHATRADLLRRLHRTEEAAQAYRQAAALAPPGPEKAFLREQARLLSTEIPVRRGHGRAPGPGWELIP